MLSISDIKYLKSLHHKKYRKEERKILLEGQRLIQQILIYKIIPDKVWMTEDYFESKSGKTFQSILLDKRIALKIESEKNIQKVCDSKNCQGIIALITFPKYIKSK